MTDVIDNGSDETQAVDAIAAYGASVFIAHIYRSYYVEHRTSNVERPAFVVV